MVTCHPCVDLSELTNSPSWWTGFGVAPAVHSTDMDESSVENDSIRKRALAKEVQQLRSTAAQCRALATTETSHSHVASAQQEVLPTTQARASVSLLPTPTSMCGNTTEIPEDCSCQQDSHVSDHTEDETRHITQDEKHPSSEETAETREEEVWNLCSSTGNHGILCRWSNECNRFHKSVSFSRKRYSRTLTPTPFPWSTFAWKVRQEEERARSVEARLTELRNRRQEAESELAAEVHGNLMRQSSSSRLSTE